MKVIKKQVNSKMCLICGINNPAGVKAPFYEMENGEVWSIFEFSQIHQSYPERTHGGMISTMLDEIIGRAIWIVDPTIWGVTTILTVKFRKPVPLDQKIKATSRITKNAKRYFIGTGEILDLEGNVLASAEATYFKLPVEKISVEDVHEEVNVYVEDGITEID